MEKAKDSNRIMDIPSFKINHTRLEKGIYVSRIDSVGGRCITTYDIRVCRPYKDKPIPGRILHTVEHIGAAILRNGAYRDWIIYFGPMGCRTGFYLIMKGEPCIELVTELMMEIFTKVSTWEGDIPGMTKRECGNYEYHDIINARSFVQDFLNSKWEHEYPIV